MSGWRRIQRWASALWLPLVVAASVIGSGGLLLVSANADAPAPTQRVLPENQWQHVYDLAARFYASETGVTLKLIDYFESVKAGHDWDGVSLGNKLAETIGEDALGMLDTTSPAKYCFILVNPADASPGLIAHETFHCLQLQILGNAYALRNLTPWIGEGGADYAECRFLPRNVNDQSIKYVRAEYAIWVETPQEPLLDRIHLTENTGYSAVGFWGLVQQADVNVFKVMPAVITAPDPQKAYEIAVGSDASKVLGLWASTLYRDPNRKPNYDWNVRGPGAPDMDATTGNIKIDSKDLNPGSHLELTAPAYAAGLYQIRVATGAKIMQVRTASGVARINGHDLDQVGVDEADYCVAAGGCGCPKGKTYQGPAINRSLAPTKPVPAIALSGGQSGGEVEVSELPIKCNRTSNTFHLSGDVTTTLTLAGSATCQNGFSPDDVQLFMTSSGQPAIPPREPSTLSLNLPGNGTTTFPSSSAAADLAYNPNGSVPNAYYWGEGLSPGSATNTTGTITIHGGGSSGTVNLTLPVILDGKQGQASTDETISGSWNCG